MAAASSSLCSQMTLTQELNWPLFLQPGHDSCLRERQRGTLSPTKTSSPDYCCPVRACVHACVRDRLPPNYTAVRVKRSGFPLKPPSAIFLADWKQIRAQNPQVAGQTKQVSVRVSSRQAQTSSRATMMEEAAHREGRGERRVTMTRILLQLLPSHRPAFLFLFGNFFFFFFSFLGPGREISFTHTRNRVEMSSFVA